MTTRKDKDTKVKEERNCKHICINGKYGDIEFIISDHKMSDKEWKQFNVDMTKIIYSNK